MKSLFYLLAFALAAFVSAVPEDAFAADLGIDPPAVILPDPIVLPELVLDAGSPVPEVAVDNLDVLAVLHDLQARLVLARLPVDVALRRALYRRSPEQRHTSILA